VRVRADLVGDPPEGYTLGPVQVIPREVMLEGARGNLRRMREVPTRSVDLSDLRQSTRRPVALVLESGHVWRADARGEPVEIEIQIHAPDETPGGQGQG
jgi:YbbR domain-containing protein